MTPDELSAIEQRANAATEGPWIDWYDSFDRGDIMARVVDDDPELEPEVEDVLFGNNSGENWTFIKAARADVPALTAEVRSAWAENEWLRAENRQLQFQLRIVGVSDQHPLDPSRCDCPYGRGEVVFSSSIKCDRCHGSGQKNWIVCPGVPPYPTAGKGVGDGPGNYI